MLIIKSILVLGSFGYHIFLLPILSYESQEKQKIYIIRVVIILIGLLFCWIIGLKPVFIYTAMLLLLYNIYWLHVHSFNPELMKSTHKEVQKLQEQLIQSNMTLENKIEVLELEKSKYDSLNTELAESNRNLHQRQEELISKENKLNKTIGELDTQIEEKVREKVNLIEKELSNKYEAHTSTFTSKLISDIEQRLDLEKETILNDIFTFDKNEVTSVFELKKKQERLREQEDEIVRKSYQLDLHKIASEASNYSLEAKKSMLDVKSENVSLKGDIRELSSELNNKLKDEKHARELSHLNLEHHIEKESQHRQSDISKVEFKIGELRHFLSDQIKDLELKTVSSLQKVETNISNLKLEFGQEILRMDGQQGQILIELEKYYTQNERFIQKMHQIGLEAKQQNIEGQNLLLKVKELHNMHLFETKSIEQRLNNSMEKVCIHEAKIANSVGESVLKLKHISDQQYIAMKDLALEKKDVNLLWKEKNVEHELNLQELKYAKENLDHTRRLFDKEKDSAMKTTRLTHQLYMNEQHYNQALFKERNSKGFLSRLAAAIENPKS